MAANSIELTPEWLKTLYKNCLANNGGELVEPQLNNAYFCYLKSRKKCWKTVQSVANYFSTFCEPSAELSADQMRDLLTQMFDAKWDLATFSALELGSKFHQVLRDFLAQNHLTWQQESAFVNWQLRVEKSPEEYFATLPSLLRSTIKRKTKKLQKHNHEFKLITKPNQLPAAFQDYKSIYQKSWKPAEEHIDFIEEFCGIAAQNGWLRLGILYLNQEAIAAQIWFVYGSTASIFKLAYLPEFKEFSAGTLVTEMLMRYVLQQDNVRLVDFGMGDEPYKEDWMNFKNVRHTITVFNNNFMGKLACLRFKTLPKIKRKLLK